uniref:Uncharacterized protein n=1 Tax=Arundo donax TaxID=35708 RepID=A0A0A9HHR9_ARUDO
MEISHVLYVLYVNIAIASNLPVFLFLCIIY